MYLVMWKFPMSKKKKERFFFPPACDTVRAEDVRAKLSAKQDILERENALVHAAISHRESPARHLPRIVAPARHPIIHT